MANNSTLSRPYAQALFEHSDDWSSDLEKISLAVRDPGVANLIDSPHLSYQDKVEQFLALFEGEIESNAVNFLKVLGESKRLSLIPDIEKEYRALIEQQQRKGEDGRAFLAFCSFSRAARKSNNIPKEALWRKFNNRGRRG